MKIKAIGKIPYLTLPACDPDEGVSYVGRTACRNIGHERHIILEVYENREGCLQVPVVRYAATKKDWGVYYTDTGKWSRKKIDSFCWGYGLCWYDEKLVRQARGRKDMERENKLYEEKDLSRIRSFFKGIKVWRDTCWWEYFEKNEVKVKNGEDLRKYERRKERLKGRISAAPKLDEQALLDWADGHIFHRQHYLYYKKHGSRADVCCSACGGVDSGKWKAGQSYEGIFERHMQEPREGMAGRCRMCGEYGIYKPQGKARASKEQKKDVFLVDRYLEKGVILRSITVYKEWQLEEACGEKGPEMHAAYEKITGIEVARTYFLPGKKVHTDYHKHDRYAGKDFWDDCNLYGMNNIRIEKGLVCPPSFENIKGTFLRYSALEQYAAEVGELNVKDYLERYMEFPQIEMLVKMGMREIVEHMVDHECGLIRDRSARRMDRLLGIRKDKVKLLAAQNGSITVLKILQKEKHLGANWTWQQVMGLEELGAWNKELEPALEVMSLQRLLNIISGYAGCGYGTGCSHAVGRLEAAAREYLDYLQMRKSLGYDMGNTVGQKPRDLHAAHDRMAAEQNQKKEDERLKEAAEKFPDIKKDYRKLWKQYFYEDGMYLIRPARSAEEIVREGRALHHCVGGDNYLRKHNDGHSYILMLRFKQMPETPYVTVEISGTDRILQWYGAHDKKPDQENVQEWLDKYLERLKGGSLNAERETIRERALLMAAV